MQRAAQGGRRRLLLLLLAAIPFALPAAERPVAGDDASPPAIGMLGIWDRAKPLVERAGRETGIPVRLLGEDSAVDGLRVLFVLNLDSARVPALADRLRQADPRPLVIPLDARDTQMPLRQADLLLDDEHVPAYWRANGLVNMRRLLNYAAVRYLGREGDIEPPMVIPEAGFYHPGLGELAPDLAAYRKARPRPPDAPTAALLIQQSFWITEDTQVIDAEIHALEAVGFDVVAFFSESGARMAAMLEAVDPEILVEDRHGGIWEGSDGRSLLELLDVPYLRPISMLGATVAEWRADPQGLAHRDRSLFLTLQESKGIIEPIVVGGLTANVQGFRLHEPIPERVERFAQRAWAWWQLRHKADADKRVAIVYYNKYLGKSDLMRGSPTGAFLDGPRSLLAFLPRLAQAGYTVENLPTDVDELIGRLQERGRNIGPWAQGELEELADLPGAILVPVSQYRTWFESRLDEPNRHAVIEHFGPPPGRLMVVTRNGEPHIVLPGIRLGNVLLAPQPARGAEQDEALLHSRDVPPPHNYLAFYWWLQEVFKADAVVHWGTHGSLELLPGKEAGLSDDDWSDICVGTMPVINPWIMDNIAEATLSRRRSYALLVDHLPPPAVDAGLADELMLLHDDIHKFKEVEPGVLREEFRRGITQAVLQRGIDQSMGLALDGRELSDAEIDEVALHLHEIATTTTPTTLHVLGRPPQEDLLPSYLVSILRRSFLDRFAEIAPHEHDHGQAAQAEHEPHEHAAAGELERYQQLRPLAEDLVRRTVLGNEEPPQALREDIAFARDMLGRLRQADAEITGVLHALDGGYVPPGPGPDPIRNPSSVPSGRNLYALNPEEIPTPASWRVAVQLIDGMLVDKRPQKVGFDLNGMNTMRDYGVVEGQILYLLGVRPVWNHNNLAIDVELIPREELGRPRIDVFVAMGGQYKENFPSRVELIDKAVRLATRQEEPDNRVRQGTQQLRQALLQRGFAEDQAELLAPARVFGTKPGNMSGTNILHLIPRSGVWEDDSEVSSVYIDSMSYVYTGGIWGEQIDGLYQNAIQGTDTLIRVWASNMTSQLSNHHAYEYLGGLSMAIKRLTGREPDALIADVRDPDGARMRGFTEVLATNLRSELLNRKWITGMMAHDYAGAGHMAELVKNTFGWSVTRSSSVGGWAWEEIDSIYQQDRYELGLRAWFEQNNPHALQEITATMLEAARKGYWQASEARLAELTKAFAESVAAHGLSAGLITGGNQALQSFVEEHLQAPGQRGLAERFSQAVAQSSGASDSAPGKVHGAKLEESSERVDPVADGGDAPPWWLAIGAVFALLVGLGIWRRSGAPS